MRLPNADGAIIDEAKLRDYLLSPSHPVGRFKAAFFAALGYTEGNWHQLQVDIREQHLPEPAQLGRPSPFGRTYEIRAPLRGPSGRIVPLVTVWIVLNDEEVPQLITAYPGS